MTTRDDLISAKAGVDAEIRAAKDKLATARRVAARGGPKLEQAEYDRLHTDLVVLQRQSQDLQDKIGQTRGDFTLATVDALAKDIRKEAEDMPSPYGDVFVTAATALDRLKDKAHELEDRIKALEKKGSRP